MSKKELDKKKLKDNTRGLINEFKTFVKRGNVVDLAVGVIIGSAFGKIVTSLVDDMLMPLIGVIIGGIDFSNLSIKVGTATIKYGMFIQNVINFLIVAFCIFLFVKIINKFLNKEKKEEVKVPKKTNEELLLEEIRDILKERK